MDVLLDHPMTIVRNGKTHTITRVQTCWFTGGIITNFTRTAVDRWSLEHIVPQSSLLFKTLTDSQCKKNTVPTFAHANVAANNHSIVLKYIFRDRLRMELYGTTDLTTIPLEERAHWSKELRQLIDRVAVEVFGDYRLRDKWFWTNPVVVPAEGIRMWTLENPHHGWTETDLARRESALENIRAATKTVLLQRFPDFNYTDEVDAAVRADLRMDLR